MRSGLGLVHAVRRDDRAASVVERDRVARAEEDVRLAPVSREHEVLPGHPVESRGQVSHLEVVGEAERRIERLPHVDDDALVGRAWCPSA